MQMLLPEAGYTLPTAARIIGIHEKSIYRLVKQGKLLPFLDTSGRLMISREEVYSYLKRKENQ
jgi:excisionase family DNA binding protein